MDVAIVFVAVVGSIVVGALAAICIAELGSMWTE